MKKVSLRPYGFNSGLAHKCVVMPERDANALKKGDIVSYLDEKWTVWNISSSPRVAQVAKTPNGLVIYEV
jgi:hypothetical protein